MQSPHTLSLTAVETITFHHPCPWMQGFFEKRKSGPGPHAASARTAQRWWSADATWLCVHDTRAEMAGLVGPLQKSLILLAMAFPG